MFLEACATIVCTTRKERIVNSANLTSSETHFVQSTIPMSVVHVNVTREVHFMKEFVKGRRTQSKTWLPASVIANQTLTEQSESSNASPALNYPDLAAIDVRTVTGTWNKTILMAVKSALATCLEPWTTKDATRWTVLAPASGWLLEKIVIVVCRIISVCRRILMDASLVIAILEELLTMNAMW